MQNKSHIILDNGHMGVRMQDMVGKVKLVKYHNTKSVKCIIGDANIEDICHVPTHITSFFKLLGENLNSITDLKRWGESTGGITHWRLRPFMISMASIFSRLPNRYFAG